MDLSVQNSEQDAAASLHPSALCLGTSVRAIKRANSFYIPKWVDLITAIRNQTLVGQHASARQFSQQSLPQDRPYLCGISPQEESLS